jgi:intracellular sulfur oxidation DsrE/DsrF family protein
VRFFVDFKLLAVSATIAAWPVPGQAQSQSTEQPLIAGYGHYFPVPNAKELPEPSQDYKVLFNISKSDQDGSPPPELDKVARLVNLLSASGVPARHRHLVVVIYGPATTSVLTNEASQLRDKRANASIPLIKALAAAAVRIDVCGQALAHWKISPKDVLPQVQVDLSGMTTLINLQLNGYALLSD